MELYKTYPQTVDETYHLQTELQVINSQLKDYLQKVEFDLEQLDPDYVKTLQDRRVSIKKQIIAQTKLKEQNKNSRKVYKPVSNSDAVERLVKRCTHLEAQIASLTDSLNREKRIRTQLSDKVDEHRRFNLRLIHDLNPDNPNLFWVKDLIAKNPSWGLN